VRAESEESAQLPGVLYDAEPAALQQAWDSSPAIIAVTLGPDHLLAYQNRAAEAMFGARTPGQPLLLAFPEIGPDGVQPLDAVRSTGVTLTVGRRVVGVRDRAGGEVVLDYVLAPLGRPGRPADGVVITAIDVTAAARAEEAAGRARLLADIAARLIAAPDATSGLQALTDALVPEAADVVAIYVLADSAPDDGLESATVPPQVLTIASSLAHLGVPPPPPPRAEPSPWDASLRAGESIVLPVDETTLPALAPDAATADWLTRADAHSIAVAPLVVAGTLAGAILFMAAGDRPPFEPAGLPFLADVAARAGAAIGLLATQQRLARVASQLQRALLPAAPPSMPGLAIAARYVAGAPGADVGGDWWDVQDLGNGRAAIGIGDVSGRGISAAVVMGQARAAMQTAAQAQLAPARVLSLVDARLHEILRSGQLEEPGAPQFATACFAVVEPARQRLSVSNAGHLPLLVRRRGGAVQPVWLPPAKPLGLLIGGFTDTTLPLEPGDTLLMFTDGLVEARDRDLGEGIDLLAEAFGELGGLPALDDLADELLAVMSGRPGYGGDDVALLLVRP
jgi:hypothetical protein